MNNYCRNCGEKLESDIKVCPKCNVEVIENRINVEGVKKEFEDSKKIHKRYVKIVIILCLISYFLRYIDFFEKYKYIHPLFSLGTIIILIYTGIIKVKSEKNEKIHNIVIYLIYLYYMLFVISLFVTSWFI